MSYSHIRAGITFQSFHKIIRFYDLIQMFCSVPSQTSGSVSALTNSQQRIKIVHVSRGVEPLSLNESDDYHLSITNVLSNLRSNKCPEINLHILLFYYSDSVALSPDCMHSIRYKEGNISC